MGPDKVNWDYFTKNIPYPSETEYRLILVEKTSKFLKNVRWKALAFLYPNQYREIKETFGFKSEKNPPEIMEIKSFEDRILNMIENVQFREKSRRKNSFQKQMSNDIKGMSKEHVYVKSDKTKNYFKLKPEKHETLLERNIQKEYKK